MVDVRVGEAGQWGLCETKPAAAVRRASRWGRRLRRAGGLMVGLLLLALAAQVGTAAAAAAWNPFGDLVEDAVCGIVSPEESMSPPGDGPESIAPNRNLAGVVPPGAGSAPEFADEVRAFPGSLDGLTLYEVAGLRSTTWYVMTTTPTGDKSCSLVNWMWTQVANAIVFVKNGLLQGIIALKEAATGTNPLAWLYENADTPVAALFVEFAVPMGVGMLIVLAIAVALKSTLAKGFRAALGTALAALLILVALGAVYADSSDGFKLIADVADQTTAAINDGLSEVLLESTVAAGGFCEAPLDSDAGEIGQRITSCVLADALAYTPWALGEFGAAGQQPIAWPEDVLIQPAPGPEDVDRRIVPCYVNYQGCEEVRSYLLTQWAAPESVGGIVPREQMGACVLAVWITADLEDDFEQLTRLGATCSPMYATYQNIAEQSYASTFQGVNSMNRVMQALMALIGTIITGGAVALLAVLVLIWHARTFGLWLIGPLKLVAALWPGKAHMAREWATGLGFTWAARVAYGITLTLSVLTTSWVFSSDQPSALKLVWLVIILYAFFKMVTKVQESLQTNSSAQDVGRVQRGATVAAGVAAGAGVRSYTAGRGGAGGAAAAVSRRKAMLTDPTASRGRKFAAVAAAPFAVVGAGAKGAATGAVHGRGTDVERALRRRDKAGAPGLPGQPPAAVTVRRAPPTASAGTSPAPAAPAAPASPAKPAPEVAEPTVRRPAPVGRPR